MSSNLKENKDNSLDVAEFLGWHMGDGCISVNNRYSEYALTGDIVEEHPFYKEVVVPTFNKIFKEELKKEITLKEYNKTGVCGFYIFDRNFVELLKEKFKLNHGKKTNIHLHRLFKTNEETKYFLRGLFDTDGSIYFCKSNYKTKKRSLFRTFHYKPKIKVAVISKELIDQVYLMLKKLGFSPRIYAPQRQRKNENIIYALVLETKKDTQKWIEEIGFKNSKHITKIKIWEKFGFCPPYTKLNQRINMLKGNLNPLTFYPSYGNISLVVVKKELFKYRTLENQ